MTAVDPCRKACQELLFSFDGWTPVFISIPYKNSKRFQLAMV